MLYYNSQFEDISTKISYIHKNIIQLRFPIFKEPSSCFVLMFSLFRSLVEE
jgi:hypothetical protein